MVQYAQQATPFRGACAWRQGVHRILASLFYARISTAAKRIAALTARAVLVASKSLCRVVSLMCIGRSSLSVSRPQVLLHREGFSMPPIRLC